MLPRTMLLATAAMMGSTLWAAAQTSTAQPSSAPARHNLILFVPDGLRAQIVTPQTAPTMAAIRDQGVNFANPHSLFPTFTMANASGLATGHQLGDSGMFGNTIFASYPVGPAAGSVTPFVENDAVLGDLDEHSDGNFINEETLLAAARAKGYGTAAIGKVGPALMFDHTERSGAHTIVVDDSTGTPTGIPLSAATQEALKAAGLPLAAPPRGDNGKGGDAQTPGTRVANVTQQGYFADVAAKVVLPVLKARNAPFVLVFWSRDPDGTQHNQGDSLGSVTPGINGPTSLAAIYNADDNLRELRQALVDLGLADTTDIVVSADHGFSTVSKESGTSPSAKRSYKDVPQGRLPPGFLALDIADALGAKVFDPDAKNAEVAPDAHPSRGNGLIGSNAGSPAVVVAANGGSDLVYLPTKDHDVTAKVVEALLRQDYVSGLFVDEELGQFPGALRISNINLAGGAKTPRPSIVVNFRSYSTGCENPALCAAEVADTTYQQGQGMHGNFSRADTMNFMAAFGPDFKKGFQDPAPVSNADIGRTLAHVLGLDMHDKGSLVGRVIEEALPNGDVPDFTSRSLKSEATPSGLQTVLMTQTVGQTRYFDAAGFAGRTVGLEEKKAASAQ